MQFLNQLSISMMTKAIAVATALMIFSIADFAQAAGPQTSQILELEDVEELLDNVARYNNQKVKVSGEVEEVIDRQAFILESGGLFNDEIVVLIPKNNMRVEEDSEVTVTGTVRAVGLVEIEREYGWDLDPQIKIELENVEAYLIADRIER